MKNRNSERRRSLVPIVSERRSGKSRRVACPLCNSPLLVDKRQEVGFSEVTQVCTSSACSFTHVGREVPKGKIRLEPEYEIVVEKMGQRLFISLPIELCHFAKLEVKQKLRLKARDAERWVIEKH